MGCSFTYARARCTRAGARLVLPAYKHVHSLASSCKTVCQSNVLYQPRMCQLSHRCQTPFQAKRGCKTRRRWTAQPALPAPRIPVRLIDLVHNLVLASPVGVRHHHRHVRERGAACSVFVALSGHKPRLDPNVRLWLEPRCFALALALAHLAVLGRQVLDDVFAQGKRSADRDGKEERSSNAWGVGQGE